MTIVLMTVVKYALHSVDLQSENPWENKAVYLLYSELILGRLHLDLYKLSLSVDYSLTLLQKGHQSAPGLSLI